MCDVYTKLESRLELGGRAPRYPLACDAVRHTLDGHVLDFTLLGYVTTVVGLFYGFVASNTFFFLCAPRPGTCIIFAVLFSPHAGRSKRMAALVHTQQHHGYLPACICSCAQVAAVRDLVQCDIPRSCCSQPVRPPARFARLARSACDCFTPCRPSGRRATWRCTASPPTTADGIIY